MPILVSIEKYIFLFTYKEHEPIMKRLIISLTLVSMGAIALAPAADASMRRQSARSEGTSLVEFIRNNRDARSKS